MKSFGIIEGLLALTLIGFLLHSFYSAFAAIWSESDVNWHIKWVITDLFVMLILGVTCSAVFEGEDEE